VLQPRDAARWSLHRQRSGPWGDPYGRFGLAPAAAIPIVVVVAPTPRRAHALVTLAAAVAVATVIRTGVNTDADTYGADMRADPRSRRIGASRSQERQSENHAR
jgi:hypothetical protein